MTPSPARQDRIALVVGVRPGRSDEIVEALEAAGSTVVAEHAVDDADANPDADGALVARVVEAHGRLDVLVVVADGVPEAGDATAVVHRTLLVPLHLATAANRVMQAQETGGTIVILTTAAGREPSPGVAVFGAATAGLIHLTSSLAVAWGPQVRVNAVSAAVGDAPTPLGRGVTPGDVAGAVAWLASPASAYVSGIDLAVHGGGRPPAFLGAVAGS